MRFLTASLALALVGCGGSPTSPSTGLSLGRRIDTPAIVFHFSANDTVDVDWQEAYDTWAVAALQVSVTRQISYNKYLSRSHMGDLTGNYNTNGFANPETFEIHTLWPRDNHEVVHLYSSLFGRPVARWNEGLAVAFQTNPPSGDFVPRWSGTPVHDLARQFRQSGRLIAIADLLATNDFRRFDPNVTYPEAGSFVRFVLDTYGLETLKRLFGLGNASNSPDVVRQQFQTVYGRPIADVEIDWWAMLDTR
jgi:hypothetical protein